VVPWKLRGTLRRDKKLLLGVHAQNGKSLERRRWGAVEEETNHVEVFAVPSRFKTSALFFFLHHETVNMMACRVSRAGWRAKCLKEFRSQASDLFVTREMRIR